VYTIDWNGLLARTAAIRTDRLATGRAAARPTPVRIHPRVKGLAFTSFFTDISSEMVSSILPIYLVLHLRLSPLAFGVADGLYQGVSALVRLTSGLVADRGRSYKGIAAVGYGLSAACKLALLPAGANGMAVASLIAADRTGKGIRTAPRDALISLSTPKGELATAFAAHRALDAAGAMLGPLVAFALLAWMPGRFDALFVVSFCVALVGLAVLMCFVDTPAVEPAAPRETVSWQAALGLLAARPFRHLSVAGTTLCVATLSDSLVFLSLQRQLDFSAAYFPLLYVAVALCNCVFAFPAGRLADARGRTAVFVGGHVLLLGVYILLLVPMSGFVRLVALIPLFGAYYAATDGVLAAMAGAALPPHLCGSGLALLSTLTNLARLLASILFGAAWMWLGIGPATALFAGALALAIGFAFVSLQSRPDSEAGCHAV
jgi:MFS family permease